VGWQRGRKRKEERLNKYLGELLDLMGKNQVVVNASGNPGKKPGQGNIRSMRIRR
jgi:hypothetical protein